MFAMSSPSHLSRNLTWKWELSLEIFSRRSAFVTVERCPGKIQEISDVEIVVTNGMSFA